MPPSTETLQDQLDSLTKRVTELESRAESGSRAPATPPASAPALDPEAFWALEGVQSRRTDHPSTTEGMVMLVGSLTLPGGAPVAWQEGAGTAGLLESDWTERATAFAALGHPVRLELLRHMLGGIRSTAELAEIDGLGTTGQLHHHLRQLVAAGWVRQSGRGSYEVPAGRVVPLLAAMLGAER